jgi:hypothetical protein
VLPHLRRLALIPNTFNLNSGVTLLTITFFAERKEEMTYFLIAISRVLKMAKVTA